MAKMTGSQAILQCFKKEGVDLAFGYPGGTIMPLFDAMLEEKWFRHILARHEQGAAHEAQGYARVTGKVGVAISTSGPGATNLITGLVDAYLDSTPIVALSGQVPTPLIGNDAFQEADMFGMTMPMTKHNYKLLGVNEIPLSFKNAFHIARSGRPGPVHIDLPKDVLTNSLDFSYPEKPVTPGYNPPIRPGHPEQIRRAVEILAGADQPLILVGGGVIASGASKEVQRLAETLFAPIVTTLMAKGAVDERHPLVLGMPGMHGKRVCNYALANADVIVAIGCRFADRITGKVSTFAPQMRHLIHIDIDSAEIGKNIDRADIPIVGDAKLTLQAILQVLGDRKKHKNAWTDRLREIKANCECNLDYDETPIWPHKAMYELQKAINEKTIIVTEVGQNQMWAAHFLKITGPRKFVTSGGLGTMGFGLPASIGAKAGKPDHRVIDVAGDGSVMMTCQELGTSKTADLPFTCYLLNNGWLGMVKQWQKLFFNKRYSGTHLGSTTDFVKLAQAFGCDGERVSRPSELAGALKRAAKSGVAYMVDIAVDPEVDVLPMVAPGGDADSRSMIGSGVGCSKWREPGPLRMNRS